MSLSRSEKMFLWVLQKFTPSPWKSKHLFRRGLVATSLITLLFYASIFVKTPVSLTQLQALNIPLIYLSGLGIFLSGLVASYIRIGGFSDSEVEENIVSPSKTKKRLLLLWLICSAILLEASYLGIKIYGIPPDSPSFDIITLGILLNCSLIISAIALYIAVFKHLLSIGPSYEGDRRYYVNEYTLLEDKWIEASALLEEGHQQLQEDNPAKAVYSFSKAASRYNYLAEYGERDTYQKVAKAHSKASEAYKNSVFQSTEEDKQKLFEKGNYFITKANEALKYRYCDSCGFLTNVSEIHRAVSADGIERKLECNSCHSGTERTEDALDEPFEDIKSVAEEFEQMYTNKQKEEKQEQQKKESEEKVTDPYGEHLSEGEEEEVEEEILSDDIDELNLDEISTEDGSESDKTDETRNHKSSTQTKTKRRDAREKTTKIDETEFTEFTKQETKETKETTTRRGKIDDKTEEDEDEDDKERTSGYSPSQEDNASTRRRHRGVKRSPSANTKDTKRKRSTDRKSKTETTQTTETPTSSQKQQTRPTSSQEPVSSAQQDTTDEPKTTVEEDSEDETETQDSVTTKPEREVSDTTGRVTVEWACEVLQIEKPLDQAKIKQAYREEVTRTHPDNGGSTEAFEKVQDAKERLETYLKYTTE